MIADLFVKLGLKSEEFNRGIDQAKAKTSSFGSMIGKVGGMIAAAFAVGAIFSFVKSTIAGYDEIAKANAKLESVLKSTGGAAGMTSNSLAILTDQLFKTSLYEDDVIVNAEALMLTFTKIGKTAFPGAMQAAADMSAVLGTDLQGSVIQLGKALNSPTQGLTALKRSGVSFTESQIAVIKSLEDTGRLAEAQQMILAELATEFGGAAQAAANAGTGGLTMLAKAFQNIKQSMGEVIVESALWKETIGVALQYLNDLSTIIEDKSTPAWKKWLVVLEDAVGIDWWDNFDAIKKSGEEFKKQQDSAKKSIDEYSAQEAEYQKASTKASQEKLTASQQYKSAIDALKNAIAGAKREQEGLTGDEFIEAEKKTQDATKALEDYIAAHKSLKREKNLLEMQGNFGGIGFGTDKGTPKGEQTKLGANGLFEVKKQSIAELGKSTFVKAESKELELQAIRDKNQKIEEEEQRFNESINNLIAAGMQDAAVTFGEGIGALMTGDMNVGEFGATLLGVVGRFLTQFGQLIIGYAIAAAGLQAAIEVPGMWPVALAAGIALVAIGSAISSLSKKGLSGSGGGGGGSSAASGSGSYNSPGNGQGQSQDNRVVFEIQGTKLVGVLANTDTNRRVTG